MNPTLEEHLGYLADPIRHAKLQTAVARLIKPGDRVVDLGCGSGILGLVSLQAGAAFVDAIDDGPMINVARETFQRAGFGKQAAFHSANSFSVTLEQPADLLVCDHVGYFGIDYGLLDLLSDAKTRFLKPGGRILPCRVRLRVGSVQSEALRERAEGWASPKVPSEFHWLRNHGINAKYAADLKASDLLSPLVDIADLKLGEQYPSTLSWQCELVASRDGFVDGLVGCFDAELAPGVWMTNSPLATGAIARPKAFLPIASRLSVKAGDRMLVTVRQVPSENLVTWQVHHLESDKRFSHSTFAGQLITQRSLAWHRLDRRPLLSHRGKARKTVLDYVDGLRTAAEIEQAVLHDHPNLFPSAAEIRRFVVATLGRDTE